MSIVARIKFGCKLEISTSAIGYYSYTNRYMQIKTELLSSKKLIKIKR